MDIFGRKKRTRQPTDPAEKSIPYERTSSGRNPVHIDTISAPTNYAREFEREREREMQHRMHITAPLSNPNLASGSARYLGPDDPTRLSRTISPSSPDDFGMYNSSSPSSTIAHRRNLSNASSGGTSTRYATAHAVTSSPGNTQYLTQSSAGSQGRSSHYTSSVAGSQYGHAPSGSISRTSIASSSPFNTEHHHVHRPASPPPSQERNFARGDFEYRRPSDADVERLFFELMHKRDFFSDGGNMSDQYKEEARKNMLNFPVDKKWQLVYNDKLTEFHAERESKRQQVNTATPGRSHGAGAGGSRQGAGGTALNRNSPEWFIKKFLDGTVTTKHIESLIVMLRTCPLGWIQTFVAAKGTAVLASFLGSLHAKNPKSEVDVALEHEVLRAFRALFNSKPGANDALGQPKCVSGIAQSMVSTHLNTRKQAADILLFLCHWDKPTGHRLVLRGFDDLKSATGDHGRFDAWFRILEQTLDGRGKMGSMVGASDEIKKLSMSSSFSGFNGSSSDRVAAGNALESSLNEYAINNMFLVNAILNPDIVTEFEVRVHLRNQMDASGLQRILIKMRAFKNSHLDDQILNFEKGAELDHEDVVETFNRDVLTDMSDPVDVFKAVMEKVQGSRAYDFFLSGMQHLLLIRQEGDNLAHYYQLIDSLITAVVMDRKGAVESNDISSLLGVSVNSVLSRFADQDQIQATQQELQRTKVKAAAEEARRAELEEELKKGGEGLVGQLREKVEKLEEDLDVSRGNQDATLRDMEELERGYVDRITGMEVQIRELYDMLRESSGAEGLVMQSSESLGRKDLVATLEKQLERNRTIKKLEANAKKRVAPTAANGMPSTMVKEEEEDEVEDETISADDTSRAVAETSGSTEEESEEAEMDDQAREAAKWKIQAALAAGMANRTDLQSRMTEAREARQTRRRKSNRNDSGTSDVGTLPASPHSTSARSTKVLSGSGAGGITAEPEALERYSSPPPRPPSRSLSTHSSHSGRASKAQDLPPMPEPQQVMEQVQRHSQAPSQVQERQEPPSAPSFLDEIRKRSVDVNTSSQEDMYPAPPIPPPPPPPPSVSHVIPDQGAPPAPPAPPPPPPPPMVSATGVAVAPSFIAPPMPPPPPPPPPAPPGAMMRDVHTSTVPPVPNLATRNFSPKSAAAMASASAAAAAIANPELRRDSMLNVRTSYAGDLGPAGPVTAPPPPPVPAYLAQQLVNRREVLEMARSRTKQLQWDKISAQHAAETVWARSAEDEEKLTRLLRSEGLFDEMEEDFKAKQAARRATTGAGAKKDKLELKTHLSLQTRQGIEMVLRRVKSSLVAGAKHATPEEVAHHIVNCNEAVLDQSFLTELLRHYPESETKGQLGEYRNASDEELRLLHPADRLVVLLMTVPHLKEKVKGLLYMTKYRETYDLIKEGSTRIREGAEGIQDAENFARLLQLILMMGNYLNATGVQGGAFGFKVSSVNKLVDTKAADGTTLLHFVERTISKCFPEVEGFMQELEKPSEACRVQLLDLKRDLAELKSGSMQHKKELDRFLDEDSSRTSDPYAKLMLPFLNEASSELSRLSDQVQLTERVYLDALRYFGEGPDPKRRGFPTAPPLRTEDFFGIFKEFGAAYRKVKSDNIRIGEQRAMEAKRRAAAEEKEKERLEAMARKEAGVDDSAVLETLLGSLRSGGTTPKQKRKARERRSAAKDGTGPNSTSPASLLTGSAVPPDANPSDMAQAMLAKLQGGVPGGGAPSASAAPPRTTRRRERRTTAERERDRESTNTVTTNASRASGSVRGEWEPELLREEAEGPVADDGEEVQHDSADNTADALVAAALGGEVASAVGGEDGHGPNVVERSQQAEHEEDSEFFEQDDFHEADEGSGARGDHPQDDFDPPEFHAQNGIVSLDRPSPARQQHLAADSSNPADGLDWFDPDRSGFSVSSGGAAQ